MVRKITEYNARELLALSKVDTPKRYARRLEVGDSRLSSAVIDFTTGAAILTFNTHDHQQTIQMDEFVKLVSEDVAKSIKSGMTRNEILKVLRGSIRLILEAGDILLDCDCSDYKYRFNWIAKQYGFAKADRIQGHDYAPDISNPRYKGGLCKHVIRVLSRASAWSDSASRRLLNELWNNDEFQSKLEELAGLNEDNTKDEVPNEEPVVNEQPTDTPVEDSVEEPVDDTTEMTDNQSTDTNSTDDTDEQLLIDDNDEELTEDEK